MGTRRQAGRATLKPRNPRGKKTGPGGVSPTGPNAEAPVTLPPTGSSHSSGPPKAPALDFRRNPGAGLGRGECFVPPCTPAPNAKEGYGCGCPPTVRQVSSRAVGIFPTKTPSRGVPSGCSTLRAVQLDAKRGVDVVGEMEPIFALDDHVPDCLPGLGLVPPAPLVRHNGNPTFG